MSTPSSCTTCPFLQEGRAHWCVIVEVLGTDEQRSGLYRRRESPSQCTSGRFICCPIYQGVERTLEDVNQLRSAAAGPYRRSA